MARNVDFRMVKPEQAAAGPAVEEEAKAVTPPDKADEAPPLPQSDPEPPAEPESGDKKKGRKNP